MEEDKEVSSVLSVSSLIDFLMNLLRDEAAQAEFERDPHGMLARHGLDGLCGQDVRDAAPILADHSGVHVKSGGQAVHYHSTDDDPVREINYIKQNYEVNTTVYDNDVYNFSYVDDRDTIITVDDRDTTTINADGDVTITDSFNQDNDVNVIEDSFNQDNDGVDNKGGIINDSAVAGDDIEESFNEDNSVQVEDSYNTDNSTEATVEDSYNQDNDVIDVDVASDDDVIDVASEDLEPVA